MKLTDFFASDRQIADTAKVPTDATKSSIMHRQIRSLVPGQTLYGEVLSRSGSDVQVRISEDFILQARLDQHMNLDIGKIMTFEVKNTGKSLILSPLFTNVATDANVMKALDMASLPVNESTVTMTQKLMEAGLPIDKNSLQQVYREINQFMDSEILDIVNLHKLQMPVNEQNVTQMASYRNLTHQLVDGLNNVLEGIPDFLNQMIDSGNTQGAVKLYQQLVLFAGEMQQGEGAVAESPLDTPANSTVTANIIADASPATNTIVGEAATQTLLETIPTDGQEVSVADKVIVDGSGESSTIPLNTQENATQTAGVSDKAVSLFENHLLGTELPNKEELAKALKPVLQLLKEQWTITPEEVADPENVEKLYNKLNRQLKSLAQNLEAMGDRSSTVYRAVTNLSQNLDFMQQMNQAYTYVQLPLRLQQGEAHGDLYVYTNKKHLAAKDGQISALLHLDMEHLGPVDVYVSMMQEKVNTKFYLQDDDMLDFIMAHMHILTERLKKRGYNCNCEMQVRAQGEQQAGTIQKLLQTEKQIPLAQYAFDVRT